MIEQIKNRINAYNYLGIDKLKVVMKSEVFEALKPSENDNEGLPHIFGCPIEKYDKIDVDWYVTEDLGK